MGYMPKQTTDMLSNLQKRFGRIQVAHLTEVIIDNSSKSFTNQGKDN